MINSKVKPQAVVADAHEDTIRSLYMESLHLVERLHRLSLIHISEPTRLGMISYAVFCLKKKNTHLRAHETRGNLVCRLLLEKKKKKKKKYMLCAV